MKKRRHKSQITMTMTPRGFPNNVVASFSPPNSPIATSKAQNNSNRELSTSDIIDYYGHLIGQLQYEGSGIWSRFNIMIGLNASLFGFIAYLYSSKLKNKEDMILIVCCAGLLFALWSIAVLKRLWLYHYHWKDKLEELDAQLPDTLVKAFTKIQHSRKKTRRSIFKTWVTSYTQPFFIIMACVWLALIVLNDKPLKKLSTYISHGYNAKLMYWHSRP